MLSRNTLMIGIPPATLASKPYCTPAFSAASKSSSPCSQIRALLAVTTDFPFSKARRVRSFASSIPPISSQIKSMSGSSTIDCELVVNADSGILTFLSFVNERTDALLGITSTPKIFSQNFPFSSKCFHVPCPTVPNPRMPIFTVWDLLSAFIFEGVRG